MNTDYKAFYLTCFDDHQMPIYQWLPPSSPKAIIHIIHGLQEHALRYTHVAETLVQSGYAVYAHDNRGHGAAAKILGDAGDNFFYNQVKDIDTIVQYHRNNYPGKKMFLLAHSMGSLLTQRYFQLHGNNIDGLILSGSNGIPDPLLPVMLATQWLQMKVYGPNHKSKIFNQILLKKFNQPFQPIRTKFDWLSRDESIVDKAMKDELMSFDCTSSFYYSLTLGVKDIFKKENIAAIPKKIPVYIFSGDKDPAGLLGKGVTQLYSNWKAAGLMHIEFKLYPNGRHEMMNEINKEEVLNDLLLWIEKHL